MEVRADALRANLRRMRDVVGPEAPLVPMVKADAYGLGVDDAVRLFEAEGVHGFGVAAVDEGIHIRALGVERPVLVLSPPPPAEIDAAVAAGLEVAASDLATVHGLADAAARLGTTAACHVEIDTGMGRAGFDARTAPAWAGELREALGRVRWAGCFTHLHSADEDPESIGAQWALLQEALAALRPPPDVLVHALNSAGALRRPEFAAGGVRPGIFLYGGSVGAGTPRPEPVVSVHARVVYVRDAPLGTTAGYGSTYRSGRDERWATVSMGYGDGLPRCLGNGGWALLHGRRVPIIGRISMDVTVVDITGVPEASPGDVVTFIGRDGGEELPVDEVAASAGTISYEILTGFTARVRRVWIQDEHPS